ncbi:terpene cyclase/mutase family protein [bacterium]|nr:terpene cyclase/mutase family protein [bacterium]
MRRWALCGMAVAFVLALSGGPTSGEDSEAQRAVEAWKKKCAAIDKGVEWLKKQQRPDGSFDYSDVPFLLQGEHMVSGCTAFASFALLKAGVYPNDPVITKAFAYLQKCNVDKVYSAGPILLAIEAKQNWEAPRQDDAPAEARPEPGTSGEGDKKGPPPPKKGKSDPNDFALAAKCVEFLVAKQQTNVWRYPMGKTEDSSAAQYALLGLDAAERLGLQVPKSVYEKAQEWFVYNQEKEGPEVPAFGVPGADLSYKDLRAIERELREKIKKIDAQFTGKKPGELGADGHTREDDVRTCSEDITKKILREKGPPMKARGWCYTYATHGGPQGGTDQDKKDTKGAAPVENELKGWKVAVNGGMTASGLACLFICKAHLDGQANYEKTLKKPIDAALRDGAAWIARNFSVTENPFHPSGWHLYYFLYGMERAGILGVIPKFGDHDWYEEGCRELLRDQKSDGSWDAGNRGTSGPVVDTSFALLFIARGTTPIVRIPSKVLTGSGGGNAGGGSGSGSGSSGKGKAEGAKYDNGE